MLGSPASGQALSVVLLDGHAAVRLAMASAFERDDAFRLLGQTGDPNEALSLCAEHLPRIVLADLRYFGNRIEICSGILQASPSTELVVYGSFFQPDEEYRYLSAGAAACLLKGQTYREIARKLILLASGESS